MSMIIQSKNKHARKKGTFLRTGGILLAIGLVLLIIGMLMIGVSHYDAHAAPIVNGHPVSDANTSTSTTTGSEYNTGADYNRVADAPLPTNPPPTDLPRPMQQPTPRPQMQQTESYSPAQGTTYSAQDSANARAVQQANAEHAQAEQQKAQAEQDRITASYRSLGDVADTSQDVSATSVSGRTPEKSTVSSSSDASDSNDPQLATSERYSDPSVPVLPLDSLIDVKLTRSLDSTFQGQFDVVVIKDVYDEKGTTLIIPSGSRCYGRSSAGSVDGQARIFAEFSLCKTPDLSRLVLSGFPAVDTDGATGLKARVDDHGANRHNRNASLLALPGMVMGSYVPGAASGLASASIGGLQQSAAGRAIAGPTLYVDASNSRPKTFSILVTHDTSFGASE